MSNIKLTDIEVKKALECCSKGTVCNGCPLFDVDGCMEHLVVCLNDLINRLEVEKDGLQKLVNLSIDTQNEMNDTITEQNAEIERLKEEIELLHSDYTYKLVKKKAKLEAYKECIEKVKEKATKKIFTYIADFSIQEAETGWLEIREEILDNLLNEFERKENIIYDD